LPAAVKGGMNAEIDIDSIGFVFCSLGAKPRDLLLMNNRLGDPSEGKPHALVLRQISRFLTSLVDWTGAPCSRTFAYMG
jgi:hypothetical protein